MIQRVSRARVVVAEDVSGAIATGILVLLGVAADDGPADVEYVAGKTRELRIFPDDAGRLNRSVQDVGGSVLVVSQFTLLGDCRKGRRPSFDAAATAPLARALYEDFVARLRGAGLDVQTGVFQADMDVDLVNHGPVTLLVDSRKAF